MQGNNGHNRFKPPHQQLYLLRTATAPQRHVRKTYMTGLDMVDHIKKTRLDKPSYKSN